MSTSDRTTPAGGVSRRGLLIGGLALGGALGLNATSFAPAVAAVRTATAGGPPAGRGGHYLAQREPLAAVPFQKLPPGAVRAKGWLAQQLQLQVDGLNGRYDEISDFLVYDNCGWVDPAKWAWEELPYWLRGLGDLGYVTGDKTILAKAERWIRGIMATQADDGWFGPQALRTSLEGGPDFWPGMPLLAAFRSWYEYSGDETVLPFMSKYFAFQNRQPDAVFNRSWGAFRWGDNIDSAYWLYNHTGDAWLLDLVRKMHNGSADYTNGIPTWHNVNLAQGFREPLEYWLLAGEQRFHDATYRDYATVMDTYGQFAGGGFAGDENCRPTFGDPRQGFETCGIVEYMHSFEMLARFTADVAWVDRCEELAFNMLPAALDDRGRVCHYITSANSIQLDNQLKHGQFQNSFPMQAYKPAVHDYRCCPHNYGMGWPYFTEELWLATSDWGVATSMYAASEARIRVGAGDNATDVSWEEITDYPFDDTVTLRLTTPRTVTFPLYLRIPLWADDASVRVDGHPVGVDAKPGSWARVEREWRGGEEVFLHLPMTTRVRTWSANHDAVSIDRGPVTFSLDIGEQTRRYAGTEDWPELEVLATSAWNYALVLPTGKGAGQTLEVVDRSPAPSTNPFTHEGAPVALRAPASRIPEWTADSEHVVGLLQQSPAATDQPVETVDLIPMGAARLRISTIPVARRDGKGNQWTYRPLVTASHCFDSDSLEAVCDGRLPASSSDGSIPRFTWWDRRGSTEWLQLNLQEVKTVSSASVYWYDDTGSGQCRVPAAWRLLWWDLGTWRPVEGATGFGVDRDRFNTVSFTPVKSRLFRVEADLQPTYSGGILELRLE